MKTSRSITFSLLLLAALALSTNGQSTTKNTGEEFRAFLVSVDAAQLELQNGKAEPFKAIWSRGEDVTLSGGFGGTVEKGWAAVSKRLDWVGSNFSKGTNRIERVVTNQHGDLGYVVQLEHIAFTVPETGKPATRDYRVTMIFRREKDGWRIIHRQADSNLTKQAPQ
ncbi:MAG: nuclear transport factor 2 family protein [Pyrinomonadaceae bacterium]